MMRNKKKNKKIGGGWGWFFCSEMGVVYFPSTVMAVWKNGVKNPLKKLFSFINAGEKLLRILFVCCCCFSSWHLKKWKKKKICTPSPTFISFQRKKKIKRKQKKKKVFHLKKRKENLCV